MEVNSEGIGPGVPGASRIKFALPLGGFLSCFRDANDGQETTTKKKNKLLKVTPHILLL
jgi:hypothetical protein